MAYWIPILALALAPAALGASPPSWPDLAVNVPTAGTGSDGDVALVVGIGDYAYLPDIPGAVENAKAWAQWFLRARGLPADRVLTLLDAQGTPKQIQLAAASLARKAGAGGRRG